MAVFSQQTLKENVLTRPYSLTQDFDPDNEPRPVYELDMPSSMYHMYAFPFGYAEPNVEDPLEFSDDSDDKDRELGPCFPGHTFPDQVREIPRDFWIDESPLSSDPDD